MEDPTNCSDTIDHLESFKLRKGKREGVSIPWPLQWSSKTNKLTNEMVKAFNSKSTNDICLKNCGGKDCQYPIKNINENTYLGRKKSNPK